MSSRNAVAAILLGGLIASSIDVCAAMLISGKDAPYILHTIAGGLLAKSAFAGGTGTMVLGLVLQWAMGLIIAAVFVLASRRLPVLARRWLLAGLAYGAVVFVVMNYVVVPLSAWRRIPHFTPQSAAENFAAMLLFGLIVAFFARSPRAGSPI
jgi:hypothetical protein